MDNFCSLVCLNWNLYNTTTKSFLVFICSKKIIPSTTTSNHPVPLQVGEVDYILRNIDKWHRKLWGRILWDKARKYLALLRTELGKFVETWFARQWKSSVVMVFRKGNVHFRNGEERSFRNDWKGNSSSWRQMKGPSRDWKKLAPRAYQ